MARTTRQRVKERDDPAPCRTCGRPTWSHAAQCVRCRWLGPPRAVRREAASGSRFAHTLAAERDPFDFNAVSPELRVGLSASGEIEGDLTCYSCGYNLRGLPADSACPECSCPVARSLAPDILSDADPRWLKNVMTGAILTTIGSVIMGFGFCVTSGYVMALGATVAPLAIFLHAPLVAVPVLGILYLTAVDASRQEEAPLAPRRLARWALLGAIGAALLSTSVPISIPAALLLAAVGSWALFRYAREIFARSGSTGYDLSAKVVSVGLPASLVFAAVPTAAGALMTGGSVVTVLPTGFTCIGLVAGVVFGVWALVVMIGLCCCASRAEGKAYHRAKASEAES